jgi:hypothetical protein
MIESTYLQRISKTDAPVSGHGGTDLQSVPSSFSEQEPHFQRVCREPSRLIDVKLSLRIHRALNQGCDQRCWGSNKEKIDRRTGEIESRKASWMYSSATYTQRERRRRIENKHARQYNRERRIEHLSGQSCDFFCGKRPSEGGNYQFAIIDGDCRGSDFSKLDKIIAHVFPELIPEPSTSGRGTHRLFKVSFDHRYGRDDELQHDSIIAWSGRLKAVTVLIAGKLGGGTTPSFCEIKGACCYWDRDRVGSDGVRGTLTMGTLARCPVNLTPEQIESLPIYSHSTIEARLRKLEKLAGLPASSKKPSVQPKPQKPARRASGQATSTCTIAADPEYLPAVQADAFQRMIHAKVKFILLNKALPETAEDLCTFYEKLGLAAGDPDPERLQRAQNVLDHARTTWVDHASRLNIQFNPRLGERATELEQLIPRDQILAMKLKCGVKHIELACYEFINLELNRQSGFASRDGIKAVLNTWHQQGHLPHLLDNHKMAAFKKLLVINRLLLITKKHKPPGWGGTAASYAPAADFLPFLPSSRVGVKLKR